jgi:hypothetical protein
MSEQIHLVVATPCFGGQVSQRALHSKSNLDLESRLDHVGPSVFSSDISSQFAVAADAA